MASRYNLEQIAFDVLEGMKFSDIADKYGISTRTLLRLRHSEEFQTILKTHKKQCYEFTLSKASYLSNIAINELKNIITNSDSNTQSKIQACKIILELAKNSYEYENIEQRICEIEKTIKV